MIPVGIPWGTVPETSRIIPGGIIPDATVVESRGGMIVVAPFMTPSVGAGVAFATASFSSPFRQGIEWKSKGQDQKNDNKKYFFQFHLAHKTITL
jgi:hypothetical protein